MTSKFIFSFLSFMALFALSPCYAYQSCEACRNECYRYGCGWTQCLNGPCHEDYPALACVSCYHQCMFVNCEQPCQPCSNEMWCVR